MPTPRTGCMTCRIRKIKCDGAKPSCQKCTSTGRTCDGYSTLPFSREDLRAASRRPQDDVGVTTNGSTESRTGLIPRFFTNTTFRGVLEKRYFQFFRECTVASTNLTVDSRFWSCFVLQVCDAESAVKHAILALASYHSSLIRQNDPDMMRQHLAYAERQYQLALTETRNFIGTAQFSQADRILTVCVLFILYEGLRGNYAASRAHMDSGRAIAAQCRQLTPEVSHKNSFREIMEVFARLDLFALTFSDLAAPYRYSLEDLLKTAPDLNPSPFKGIHHAHTCLVDLLRWMLVIGNHIHFVETEIRESGGGHDFQEELKKCGQSLSEWRDHWEVFLMKNEDANDLQAKIVELWYTMAVALLQVGFLGPETRYDSVTTHFQRMVELSEYSSSTINQTAEISCFSLELGFLIPTFFCAIRCREPDIRRRAINVLDYCERHEGIWESAGAAAISKRWMQLEEEGLGDIRSARDIPESKRISVLDTRANPERFAAQVSFKQSISLLSADETFRHETVDWSPRTVEGST